MLAYIISGIHAIEEMMTGTANARTVGQWSIQELAFTAKESHSWSAFPLSVTFRCGDDSFVVDGVWDGGDEWLVRYTFPRPGAWTWRSTSVDPAMNGLEGELSCEAPQSDEVNANPNLRGHVHPSASGHYLAYADGTPFLYLGDTCWEMNQGRCGFTGDDDGPFLTWMRDRKAKGFTVVNHWLFASGHPKADQETPSRNEGGPAFELDDAGYVFDEPRPAYYQAVDRRWRILWGNGFVMAGPPTWFGKPSRHMTLEQAQRISRYIMARYGAYNLVWALSGEYSCGKKNENPPWDVPETWQELGRHVASHNPYRHPMTIHPGPANSHVSSSQDFSDEAWLHHNWLQTGQYPAGPHRIAVWSRTEYASAPARPVLHAEGWYEGSSDKGASAYQCRYQAWSAFTNGSCGAVYGNDAIWSFHDAGDPASYNWRSGTEWRAALSDPGASHVALVGAFLRTLDWWELEPRPELLRVDGAANRAPIDGDITPPFCATTASWCLIYVPAGNAARTIELAEPPSASCVLTWLDPRTGERSEKHSVTCDGVLEIPQRPDPADDDWALLVEVE